MRVIARKTLVEYGKKYPEAKGQLVAWCKFVEKEKWLNFNDVKEFSNSADLIENQTLIFNIKGGRFRLEVKVAFRIQIVFIIWFGTHTEYDKRNKERKKCSN